MQLWEPSENIYINIHISNEQRLNFICKIFLFKNISSFSVYYSSGMYSSIHFTGSSQKTN